MLPGVVEGAGETPVLFDSGIRSGSDVVKALALGATAVGIGRPYLYGLALGSTEGAAHVLRSILARSRPPDGGQRVSGHRRRAGRGCGADLLREELNEQNFYTANCLVLEKR